MLIVHYTFINDQLATLQTYLLTRAISLERPWSMIGMMTIDVKGSERDRKLNGWDELVVKRWWGWSWMKLDWEFGAILVTVQKRYSNYKFFTLFWRILFHMTSPGSLFWFKNFKKSTILILKLENSKIWSKKLKSSHYFWLENPKSLYWSKIMKIATF